MRSNVQHRPISPAEEMGLGPKKTLLVIVTVVGCIAILFPKIFYPMIVGPAAIKDPNRVPPSMTLKILFIDLVLINPFPSRFTKTGETTSF
jgi:hypothetical protein